MKKTALSICILAAVAALLSACGGTEVYKPGTRPEYDNLRDEKHISASELREVAGEAINKLLSDDDVQEFLKEYAEERERNPELSKRPVIKLAKTRNESNDPNLNTSILTDTLFTRLKDSKFFSVTKYEGADRIREIGDSRDVIDDVNVNEATAMQEGTIQAARLILNSKVVSNQTVEGRTKVVSRFFVVYLIDNKTAQVICEIPVELGFAKKKAVVGY